MPAYSKNRKTSKKKKKKKNGVKNNKFLKVDIWYSFISYGFNN